MSIKKILIKEIKLTVKDWVFGGEDGLMVTFGALFGMSIATNENNLIILAGLLANLSNAVSMAAGDYLSTKSQAEVHKHEGFENPILSAIVMFVVCLLGALIILPFLFLNIPMARILTIIITVLALFGIGVFKSKFAKRNWIRSGLEMVVIAMIAGLLAYYVGKRFAM